MGHFWKDKIYSIHLRGIIFKYRQWILLLLDHLKSVSCYANFHIFIGVKIVVYIFPLKRSASKLCLAIPLHQKLILTLRYIFTTLTWYLPTYLPRCRLVPRQRCSIRRRGKKINNNNLSFLNTKQIIHR